MGGGIKHHDQILPAEAVLQRAFHAGELCKGIGLEPAVRFETDYPLLRVVTGAACIDRKVELPIIVVAAAVGAAAVVTSITGILREYQRVATIERE